MLRQIAAIGWAQFRIMRNHLPRTSVGSVVLNLLSLLWYGLYVSLSVFFVFELRQLPVPLLRQWLPVSLLGVFLFWQLIPLFTLSSGWSLQLSRVQIYPVSREALFAIEVLLRLTTAPEMIIVLAGGCIGLLRHPGIPFLAPVSLLLFIPVNLFLSLGVREFILHAFERNRFRELFAILIISIAVAPQLLARTGLGHRIAPYVLVIARQNSTPWAAVANLAIGRFSFESLLLLLLWTLLVYVFARRQFEKGLHQDDSFRAAPVLAPARNISRGQTSLFHRVACVPNWLFRDPLAVLVQKEFQSLLRMPRFRVALGMACVFSVVLFFPIAMNAEVANRAGFLRENFLPVVTLYGLLLISDLLLLNVFGLDRQAAQIYFVAPVSFGTVLKAKNLTAIAFIALQACAVLFLAAVTRVGLTAFDVANALAASAVVTTFFLAAGNLMSTALPRPIDAKQTFKKQAGGKMQLWLLLCALGMFVLVGFAFLARWALDMEWALLGVLLVEFAIGLIFYRIATESAIAHGIANREKLLDTLSRGHSVIAAGQ